jgi:hypothetical protein
MEPIPALFARLHFISPEAGQVLTEFKPTTDAITMELTAWFAAPAAIIAIFKMFSFFTCHRSEAETRMVAVAKTVAEEKAKVIIAAAESHGGIVLTGAPKTPANDDGAELKPDDSPEVVLEIEGSELPAFAEKPETVAEAVAAAVLKADPHKTYERKARRRKAASRDSVKAWHKECTVSRPGRFTWSSAATEDYERYCENKNLTPVNPKTFGLALAEECEVEKVRSSGRVKYLNIGLRPALRVVSA